MNSILSALLKDIVIPEILIAIRAHQNASGGKFPTEEEVIAALPLTSQRYQKIGEDFLARTDPAKQPPV